MQSLKNKYLIIFPVLGKFQGGETLLAWNVILNIDNLNMFID